MRQICSNLIDDVTLRVLLQMRMTITRQLQQIYIRALRLHIKLEDLPANDLLAALAIDSVMVLEIMISVENAFDIEIDNTSFSVNILNSFDAFADYLKTVHANDLIAAEK